MIIDRTTTQNRSLFNIDINRERTRKPRVLNKHHLGGQIPEGARYVGRGSPEGNPFIIGKDGDREEVIRKFCKEILPNLDVEHLRGLDLICFCAPKHCHADHILEKANR